MKRLTGRKDGRAYIVGCPDFALPKIAGLIIQQTVDRLAACEAIQVAAMCKKFLEMEEEKK